VRRIGMKDVPLPGQVYSPEYMRAYEAAIAAAAPLELGAKRTIAGSVDMAVVSYYASREFADLAPGTQCNRRSVLERFRAEHGSKRIGLMDTRALQAITGKLTGANQRNFKKALRGLVDHCLAKGWIKVDPLAGLKLDKLKTAGHHTWDETEIEQYRAHHAPRTRARLALELLLQTGVARADLVRIGRQHVRAGKLTMSRQKTGVPFSIPMLPELTAELARHPAKDLAFMTTETGTNYTPGGFGRRFQKWCIEAGLPAACTAHGLRKASAVRHALNGASAFELMAWHGWKTIGEAQRYVDEANRIKLAESTGARLIARTGSVEPG
jgi:integrase